MLARLSSAQRTPAEYEAMLESLPDNVRRIFVEMDVGTIREYSMRSVRRRLQENPGMAKLLDALAVRQITEQVFNNIREDQEKVKKMMAAGKESDGGSTRDRSVAYRTIRR